MPPAPAASDARAALIAGVACYAIWGVIPLAFQQMDQVGADAWEIMGHRAAWGVVCALALVLVLGQWRQVRTALANRRVMGWIVISALLIATNWTTYVMAVNNGRTLEASLGYYLNPLLNMAAGAWLFRERLSRAGLVAIGLAGVGVALQAAALGHLPWISLLLAVSFCAYGIIRKRVEVEAQPGLFLECLLLAGPGLLWILIIESRGAGHFTASPEAALWLMAAGPITVAPLALFAWAARRMPYSTLGFIQFLAPTVVFVIGVLQGEAFGWLRGVSFGFIWAGALVFAWGALKARRAARAVVASEPGLLESAEDASKR